MHGVLPCNIQNSTTAARLIEMDTSEHYRQTDPQMWEKIKEGRRADNFTQTFLLSLTCRQVDLVLC